MFNKINPILATLAILSTAAALGVVIYTKLLFQRPLPEEGAAYKEFLEESRKANYVETFKMDELVINIVNKTGRLRFLRIKSEIEPFKVAQIESLSTEMKKSQIKDKMISISSKMTPEELQSITGKILLENRIKKSLNDLWGKQIIKKIYFTQFVVQ